MNYWLSFFILLSFSTLAHSDDGRLDPHGDKRQDLKHTSIKSHTQCSICHEEIAGKITVRQNAGEQCLSCHNQTPHSGVIEHMGKPFKATGVKLDEKITCLSCHTPHRADGKPWESPGSFFPPPRDKEVQGRLKVVSRADAMIRRTCSECHKW